MTPEPVAVPWPVIPVVGSVSVTPSATMVTTAGLTDLTMSTTEVPPAAGVLGPTGAGVAGVVPPWAGAPGAGEAGVTAVVRIGAPVLASWPPFAALTARYVPPEARTVAAMTA